MALPSPVLLLAVPVFVLATACSGSADPASSPSPAPSPSPSLSPTSSPTPFSEDPLSPRPAIESPAPLGQPVCDPAAVTVTDADAVITDRVEEIFVLRTRGRACQLEGFPGVALLDADGRELAVRVTNSAQRPEPVTLSSGTSLSFSLTTGRTGSCLQAASVRVVLPGTTTRVTANTELRACGTVQTSPMQRLQDDEDEGAGG